MARLTLRNIIKQYAALRVLHEVSLEVDEGEFMVFVGPSGCGKSTLLRIIAGLDQPNAGDILINGVRVNEHSAAERGLAMVFQSYALYPHMTVRQNLAFGLENQRMPRAEIDRRIAEAARMLQIEPLLARKPGQLSGGQRQRVAIGRTVTREPGIFLFDEPLSNLDAELRVQMRVELATLHKRLASTMIYVTHDQTEAMTMANRIVVLRAGRVEQVGSPLELLQSAGQSFRGRLHRLAADEFPPRSHRRSRRFRPQDRDGRAAGDSAARHGRRACRRGNHARRQAGAHPFRRCRRPAGNGRSGGADGRRKLRVPVIALGRTDRRAVAGTKPPDCRGSGRGDDRRGRTSVQPQRK